MNEQMFKNRTRQLALKVIELVGELSGGKSGDVLGRQLLRSGTSVGANYRAACRGKSTADVISKLSNVEEEADETLYWLELLLDSKLVLPSRLEWLLKETDEILAMTVASIKTLRGRSKESKI
jgi:four helix bundle protein